MKAFALTLALTLALALLALVSPASAQELEGPTWQMEPTIDIPVVAAELAVTFGWALGSQLEPSFCAPQCDPSTVWGIDRFAAGWYSEGWVAASDIGVITMFVGSAGLLLFDEGFLPMLSDGVIIAQAIVGSIGLSILSNTSTRRPRPHLYGNNSPLEERENAKASFSFFSGHTAGAFAAATSVFMTMLERHPDSLTPWITLAVGIAGASFVGAGRLLAGQHFLTDVVAGAVVGSSLGILIPSLHSSNIRVSPTGHEGGAGLTMQMPMNL